MIKEIHTITRGIADKVCIQSRRHLVGDVSVVCNVGQGWPQDAYMMPLCVILESHRGAHCGIKRIVLRLSFERLFGPFLGPFLS